MSLNTTAAFIVALSMLVPCSNASSILRITSFNVCPKSSKWISPEISLSPFLISSDSSNNEDSERPLMVVPLSTRIFKKLEMTILPSREVCVLGEKLKNIILPYDSVFEIMTGIAVWFSPCISLPTNNDRMQCVRKSMKTVQNLDVTQFKTIYELVRRAVQHS